MIVKIQGVLESLSPSAARIDLQSGLTYEVLLPEFTASRLNGRVGQDITLHTLDYLEGSSQGANFTPRLAGFLNESDREFFTLFTSVKGIGTRKALRAMALSSERMAAAIADRDSKILQSLPEIGRRMAETIIATLHGKVDRFITTASVATSDAAGPAGDGPQPAATPRTAAAQEALAILLQLGENRLSAVQWIDQVMAKDSEIENASELVTKALEAKVGP